jgi:hypothetical protein
MARACGNAITEPKGETGMDDRLEIDTNQIAAVLLTDGKWHPVKPASFEIGTYQFKAGNRIVPGAGAAARLSELGATWRSPVGDDWYASARSHRYWPCSILFACNRRRTLSLPPRSRPTGSGRVPSAMRSTSMPSGRSAAPRDRSPMGSSLIGIPLLIGLSGWGYNPITPMKLPLVDRVPCSWITSLRFGEQSRNNK